MHYVIPGPGVFRGSLVGCATGHVGSHRAVPRARPVSPPPPGPAHVSPPSAPPSRPVSPCSAHQGHPQTCAASHRVPGLALCPPHPAPGPRHQPCPPDPPPCALGVQLGPFLHCPWLQSLSILPCTPPTSMSSLALSPRILPYATPFHPRVSWPLPPQPRALELLPLFAPKLPPGVLSPEHPLLPPAFLGRVLTRSCPYVTVFLISVSSLQDLRPVSHPSCSLRHPGPPPCPGVLFPRSCHCATPIPSPPCHPLTLCPLCHPCPMGHPGSPCHVPPPGPLIHVSLSHAMHPGH